MDYKSNKKKFFSKTFKQAVDSLKEYSYAQELFEVGCKPIASVQAVQGYGTCTIDFVGVIQYLHRESMRRLIKNLFQHVSNVNIIQCLILLKRS